MTEAAITSHLNFEKGDLMMELIKFWASAYKEANITLILKVKIATGRRLDIAGVASSILATPTIENPVRPDAWRVFCLPGGGVSPAMPTTFLGKFWACKRRANPAKSRFVRASQTSLCRAQSGRG